jgi:hypothetical protein
MVALGWFRKIEAGTIGVISLQDTPFTAWALRVSGTITMISFARITSRTDIEIALMGTSFGFATILHSLAAGDTHYRVRR